MHSSRMRTVRNTSRLLSGGGLHTHPPGAGTPPAPPWSRHPPRADPPAAMHAGIAHPPGQNDRHV